MFTVKKFSLQAARKQRVEENGRAYHAPPGFAVIDDSGNIVRRKTAIGITNFEVFVIKGTAQRHADWLNQNDGEVE